MADNNQDLHSALHKFVKDRTSIAVFPAVVKVFNDDFNTVDVEDNDGNMLFEVMLASNVGYGVSLYYKPTIGSTVFVADVGASEERYVVVAYAECDLVQVQVGATELIIDENGVKVGNGLDTLKSALDDLILQIKLITVTSAAPGSPTSVPINVAAFDAIKTRIDSLLQ